MRQINRPLILPKKNAPVFSSFFFHQTWSFSHTSSFPRRLFFTYFAWLVLLLKERKKKKKLACEIFQCRRMRIYFIYLTVFLFLSLSSFPLFFPFLQAKPLGHFSRQIPMQICIQFKSVLLSRIHHFPHPSATILPSSSLLHIGLQSIYACVHVALAWKQNMPVGFFSGEKKEEKRRPKFFQDFFLLLPLLPLSLYLVEPLVPYSTT